MTKKERESTSVPGGNPLLHYVYILRDEEGHFHIGQTNDLETRVAEHSRLPGACTSDRVGLRLVWFTHTHSGDMARRIETRLGRTLQQSPMEIGDLVDRFERLIRLIRPEMTLAEMRREAKREMREVERAFHHIPPTAGRVPLPTCADHFEYSYEYADLNGSFKGLPVPAFHGTGSWEELAREVIVHRKAERVGIEAKPRWERPLCRRCLSVMPVEYREMIQGADSPA